MRLWEKHWSITGLSKAKWSISFIHKDMIFLVYDNDCLFFRHNQISILEMIDSLKEKFDLNMEDKVAKFLGIKLNKLKDGFVEFWQDGMIGRILKAIGFRKKDLNPCNTPIKSGALGLYSKSAPYFEFSISKR